MFEMFAANMSTPSAYPRVNGKKPAVIWDYFIKIESSPDGQCMACGAAVSRNLGTTSTMIGHLKKFHVELFKKYELAQKEAKLNVSMRKSVEGIQKSKIEIRKLLKEDGLGDGHINKILDKTDEGRVGASEIDEINRVLNLEKTKNSNVPLNLTKDATDNVSGNNVAPDITGGIKYNFILPKQKEEHSAEKLPVTVSYTYEQEHLKTEVIKEEPGRSPIWKFFSKVEGKADLARCNACDEEVRRPKGTTSGMMGHLQGKHKKIYKEFKKYQSEKKKKYSQETFMQVQDDIESEEPKLVIDEYKDNAEPLNIKIEVLNYEENFDNVYVRAQNMNQMIKHEFNNIDEPRKENNSIELMFFSLVNNNTAKCNFCSRDVENEKNSMVEHLKSEGHKAYWRKYLSQINSQNDGYNNFNDYMYNKLHNQAEPSNESSAITRVNNSDKEIPSILKPYKNKLHIQAETSNGNDVLSMENKSNREISTIFKPYKNNHHDLVERLNGNDALTKVNNGNTEIQTIFDQSKSKHYNQAEIVNENDAIIHDSNSDDIEIPSMLKQYNKIKHHNQAETSNGNNSKREIVSKLYKNGHHNQVETLTGHYSIPRKNNSDTLKQYKHHNKAENLNENKAENLNENNTLTKENNANLEVRYKTEHHNQTETLNENDAITKENNANKEIPSIIKQNNRLPSQYDTSNEKEAIITNESNTYKEISSMFEEYKNLTESTEVQEVFLEDFSVKTKEVQKKEIIADQDIQRTEYILPDSQTDVNDATIWSFFENDDDFAICNFCEEVIEAQNPSIMELEDHLKGKGHAIAFQQYTKMKHAKNLENEALNDQNDDIAETLEEESQLIESLDEEENEELEEQNENTLEDLLNQQISKHEDIAKLWDEWNETNEEIAALIKKKDDVMKKITISNQDLSEIKMRAVFSQMIGNVGPDKTNSKRKRESDSFASHKRRRLVERRDSEELLKNNI